MALIQCAECGQMISDKARKCPNCGYVVSRISKTETHLAAEPAKANSAAANKKRPIPKLTATHISIGVIIIIGGIAWCIYSYNEEQARLERGKDLLAKIELERQETRKKHIQEQEERRRQEEERRRQEEERRRQEEERRQQEERERESILSWLKGTWRYRNVVWGEIMETRVWITSNMIAVSVNGRKTYTGPYTIEGNHLVYNRRNGMSQYLIIDKFWQSLKADDSHYFERY